MLRGTVVFGKIMKLLNGKTGIVFGKLFINYFILYGKL
tara:strand:- start:574 stop:687 length:114 start_codon:yes stop_codon:yes gene_type:complete